MSQCPKCGSSMEEGFVVDAGDHGSRSVSNWQVGAPEKTWWGGIKKKLPQYAIRTMRCTRCGFLENFAN